MASEVEIVIEDIAFGGKGVGRAQGKAVFIPFTIEGERVVARIVREKKSFAEAEFVRLIDSSPHRTTPQCPYFGSCGGCSYQHMHYDHQLQWKFRQVEQALIRIGKFRQPPLRPIVPSPLAYGYRNRITVHAEDNVIGFFRHDAHRLLDIEHCPIALPEVNAALAQLRAGRPRPGHYGLRAGSGPRVFSQTNDAVASRLVERIADLLPSNESGSVVIDAYCGSGAFAKRLRPSFSRVTGIDWDVHAIAAAQADASTGESYVAGDVAWHLAEQLDQSDPRLITVIVDPPATGLSSEVRAVLRERPVRMLFYVSCNPPTLARDLADLSSGFDLQSVTPFDMFPQTAEIEALAHLTVKATS